MRPLGSSSSPQPGHWGMAEGPNSLAHLTDTSAPLEERKFQFEVLKFEQERARSRGLGFFNANLGIIITAMIGVATVTVSYLQLRISSQSSAQQLALQKAVNAAQ